MCRFLAYSEDLLREGYEKLGAAPFLDFGSMVKAAPELMRLQAWRTVYDKVASFIQDEHLRQAFSFHSLLVGGNPFATSSIYALIHALERRWGVWFPRGGTGALIQGMVRLFQDLGGEIRLNSPVERITLANGRAAGVVVDDTAVTPQYLEGVDSSRELPMIRRITIGSLRNKFVFILPVALVSAVLATAGARVDTADGPVLAWLYVLDAFEGGLPSARYLGVMAEAAEIAGAPAEYVQDLRLRESRNVGPGPGPAE